MDQWAPQSTVDHCQARVAHSPELRHMAPPVDGSLPRWWEKGEESRGILTAGCTGAELAER
jgi:hypothetical protein